MQKISPPACNCDRQEISEVAGRYPMRITPHYLGLIQEAGDAIWKQCVPDRRELRATLFSDPLNETGLSPRPGLIHRYPDRVVWLVSSQCAVYCRFCMRKGRVGCNGGMIDPAGVDRCIEYIAGHPAIRDVILSGGDPLLLDDEILESVLVKLHRIPHVEMIRIGTRVPVTLPERVTLSLCKMLKRYPPIFVNTHFNHPAEITEASSRACARLADAGIPLGNQTVLLRGVNDTPHIMKVLMQRLLQIRVRPYYIHQMDLVRGTGHFRTSLDEGLRIMQGLRGHTSGLANPFYMVDLPGGKGKVPVNPDTAHREEGKWLLTSYLGETVEYCDESNDSAGGLPATVLPE